MCGWVTPFSSFSSYSSSRVSGIKIKTKVCLNPKANANGSLAIAPAPQHCLGGLWVELGAQYLERLKNLAWGSTCRLLRTLCSYNSQETRGDSYFKATIRLNGHLWASMRTKSSIIFDGKMCFQVIHKQFMNELHLIYRSAYSLKQGLRQEKKEQKWWPYNPFEYAPLLCLLHFKAVILDY